MNEQQAQAARAKAERWIEELESGRIVQMFGLFRLDSSACAIGVAMICCNTDYVTAAAASVGIDFASVNIVVCWNDSERLSFPAIASRLRDDLLDGRWGIFEEAVRNVAPAETLASSAASDLVQTAHRVEAPARERPDSRRFLHGAGR